MLKLSKDVVLSRSGNSDLDSVFVLSLAGLKVRWGHIPREPGEHAIRCFCDKDGT